jgi:hypothetical protein
MVAVVTALTQLQQEICFPEIGFKVLVLEREG